MKSFAYEFISQHKPNTKIESFEKQLKPFNIKRDTCNANLKVGDLTFSCYTCSSDQTTVYCSDCFIGGNHQEHEWMAKVQCLGQCDCGDIVSFDESGFCQKHLKNYRQRKQIILKDLDSALIKDIIYYILLSFSVQQFSRKLLKLLENNVALRILSLVVLRIQDFDSIDNFIAFIKTSSFEDQLCIQSQYVNTNISIFGTELEKAKESQETQVLFGEILPQDQLFRIGSLQQLGVHSKSLLHSSNKAILSALVQCINEPMGHYYGGQWNFFNQLYENIYAAIKDFVDNDTQNRPNGYDNFMEQTQALQGCSFNKTLTTNYSLIYYSINGILQLQKSLDLINEKMTLNVYEDVDYFTIIESRYFSYFNLFTTLILPNFGFLHYLKIDEFVDPQLLSVSHNTSSLTQQLNKSIFSSQNIKIHYDNIRLLLNYYLMQRKQSEQRIKFELVGQFIPQLYIVSLSQQFSISIKEIIIQCCDNMNYEDVLINCCEPLLIQIIHQFAILSEVVSKQNIYNFSQILEQCFKIPLMFQAQRTTIFILQHLLSQIPSKAVPFILECFKKVYPETNEQLDIDFFKLVILLLFHPDENSPEFLKIFLTTLIGPSGDFNSIFESGMLDLFDRSLIIRAIKQIYCYKPTENHLSSYSKQLKSYDYFEPTIRLISMNSSINHYIEKDDFKMPTRFKDPKSYLSQFNKVCLSLVIGVANKLHQTYIDTHENFILEFHVLRFLKSQQIFVEYVEQPLFIQFQIFYPRRCITPILFHKLDPREKLSKLKQVLKHQTKELQESATHLDQNSVAIKCQCSICHETISDIACVVFQYQDSVGILQMFQKRIMLLDEDEMKTLLTCGHYFHKSCLNNIQNSRCPICNLVFDMFLELPADLNGSNQSQVKNFVANNKDKKEMVKTINFVTKLFFQMLILITIYRYRESRDIIQSKPHYLKNSLLLIQVLEFYYRVYKYVVKVDTFEQSTQQLNQLQFFSDLHEIGLFKVPINQIDLVQFHNALKNILPVEDFFQKDQFAPSSFNLLKEVQSSICKECSLPTKYSSEFLEQEKFVCKCLTCGEYCHFSCCKNVEGLILCSHCHSGFGVLLPSFNIIIRGVLQFWPGPYRNCFGEIAVTMIGQEVFYDQQLMDHVLFMMFYGEVPKTLDGRVVQFFVKQFQGPDAITELQIRRMQQYIEGDILVMPQNDDEEEIPESDNAEADE